MAETEVGRNGSGSEGGSPGSLGSVGGSAAPFDPASLGSGNGAGNQPDGDGTGSGDGERGKRKRGRPKGSRNGAGTGTRRKSSQKAALPVEGLSKILFSVHGLLAGISQTPELALDQAEADALASAAAEVAQHYPVIADDKTLAWSNLAMTAGMIYGPRAFAIVYGGKKKPNAEGSGSVN